jgi:ABC-type amino acid transport substrate-binding protein
MLGDLNAGEIDAAILWGPLAGGDIAADAGLTSTLLLASALPPPLAYDMTLAVRLGDADLKAELDAALISAGGDIEAILTKANVPLMPLETPIR